MPVQKQPSNLQQGSAAKLRVTICRAPHGQTACQEPIIETYRQGGVTCAVPPACLSKITCFSLDLVKATETPLAGALLVPYEDLVRASSRAWFHLSPNPTLVQWYERRPAGRCIRRYLQRVSGTIRSGAVIVC